ncbi:hypothetical protein LEMLEM_LOCUS6668, partial [Lemmus lemmus]
KSLERSRNIPRKHLSLAESKKNQRSQDPRGQTVQGGADVTDFSPTGVSASPEQWKRLGSELESHCLMLPEALLLSLLTEQE